MKSLTSFATIAVVRADIAANDAAGEGATASRGDRRRRGQDIARCDAAPM
jgi:hypothetical protein